MAIIAEGAVLQTQIGYLPIEEYDKKIPVLTENGFKNINVEPILYDGQVVRLILWGFPDWLHLSSDSYGIGGTYNKCLDLGGLGICRPYNRCWEQCPDNHPNKIHFKIPETLSFRQIRKYSHVVSPTGILEYSHRDKKNAIKKFYDSGYDFSRLHKENPELIPEIDLEYILYSDPLEFKSFILGWQDGMAQTKLDAWNYFLILKNKKLAYQVQFLLNYFGIPCALEPYKSNIFGEDNWAVIWCKNKKHFHFKSFKYDNTMRTQVKKWTPFTNMTNKKWFKVSIPDESANYFCAPFYIKFSK